MKGNLKCDNRITIQILIQIQIFRIKLFLWMSPVGWESQFWLCFAKGFSTFVFTCFCFKKIWKVMSWTQGWLFWVGWIYSIVLTNWQVWTTFWTRSQFVVTYITWYTESMSIYLILALTGIWTLGCIIQSRWPTTVPSAIYSLYYRWQE